MLDVHGILVTPGAGLTLGAVGNTIVQGGDGASVAGVPIAPNARLIRWGLMSINANTIARCRFSSQDQIDPINAEDYALGTTSLVNDFHETTNLPYKTGMRQFQAGTNTGVTVAIAYTIDNYDNKGQCINGSVYSPNTVVPASVVMPGATSTVWVSNAFAPATALPNGRYAILGVLTTGITNGAVIRFQHSDFQGASPGFPIHNNTMSYTNSWEKSDKSELLYENGTQFVHMSDELGVPCCPVFNCTNAGTGLTLQLLTIQVDNSTVNVVLVKVG
jgi:hypothetical protein